MAEKARRWELGVAAHITNPVRKQGQVCWCSAHFLLVSVHPWVWFCARVCQGYRVHTCGPTGGEISLSHSLPHFWDWISHWTQNITHGIKHSDSSIQATKPGLGCPPPPPSFPALGLQACTIVPGFYEGTKDPGSDPQACMCDKHFTDWDKSLATHPSSHFLLLVQSRPPAGGQPTFRMSLPILIKLIQKLPHRQAQKFISEAIINPIRGQAGSIVTLILLDINT